MRPRRTPNRRPRKHPEPAAERPEWLSQPEPPPRGEAARDRTLLDLLPTGVLIYRLDRLLYANRAFLVTVGYDSLHALEEAGGLDALLVEPGVSNASSTSDTGTPVTISATRPAAGQVSPSETDTQACTRLRGTAIRARADLLSIRAPGRKPLLLLPHPSRRKSATPTPKNSAPSSIPRRKAS